MNLSRIARPYALAAFEYAREKQQLATWKAFLNAAAVAAKEKAVRNLLDNPNIPNAKFYDLFCDVLSPMLDSERKNFLHLLAQNQRLLVLPEISELFNQFYAEYEKISTVRVVTAIDVNDDFRQRLIRSLSNRTQHEIKLECEVDPSLIGGAIIHIGDRVIDGSIRGKLTRLLEFSLR